MKTKSKWDRIPLNTAADKLVPVSAAKRLLINRMKASGDDPETAISDVLADLRHLCKHLGLDYYRCDERGRSYYLEEVDK